MLSRLSEWIVARRKAIFALFLAFAAVSVFFINKVNINYDFTDYLGKDTQTRKSLELMNREFGATDMLSIMLTDAPEGAAQALASKINEYDEVMLSSFSAEGDTRYIDGTKYERISVTLSDCDSIAFYKELDKALAQMQGIGEYTISGSAAQTVKLEDKIAAEMPVALIIAVAVVLVVLLLTSHSYIEPLLFTIVLVVSILINMGTNFVFGTISFITFAVCAILQLALAMDYSIMLLHTYFEVKEHCDSAKRAVALALERTFMPICSSALTTVSGLASLMFMSFTIGFDIGIVLSKGIIITLISVFTFMPALIVMFSKPLEKTLHKPLPVGGRHLARFICSKPARYIVPVILIGAIALSAVMQSEVNYSFTDSNVNAETDPVTKVFGSSNSIVALLPNDGSAADYDLQREFYERISNVSYMGKPAVKNVMSIVTTGEMAVKRFSGDEVYDLLGEYMGGDDLPLTREALNGLLKSSGYENGITASELMDIIDEMKDMLIRIGVLNEDSYLLVNEARSAIDLAKRVFISDSYSRFIITLDVPVQGEGSEEVLLEIISVLNDLYPDRETGITGLMMSVYDISHAFNADLTKVSLITIFAIFLIVLVSFRNLFIPIILICAIQGAVWINFALSVPAHRDVFFMCYLICLAIQMGATIDYGILLSSNYVRLRRELLAPRDAIEQALKLSMPTIITSGLILLGAGFAIGKACTVYYIYSIGLLIASGACFSLIMVLLLLPAMLINCDRLIVRVKDRA